MWFEIVIVFGKIRNAEHIKQKSRKKVICPHCKEEVIIGIEISELKNLNKNCYSPHIHLHGNPIHALLCYVNKEVEVRNIGIIKSIEISRDSETFTQLMNKWTNPF